MEPKKSFGTFARKRGKGEKAMGKQLPACRRVVNSGGGTSYDKRPLKNHGNDVHP